ncbi:MAG: hypothetical protein A3G38_04340 [Omnitrophica WOR_2 bacterium RIFCSPLOWO2_12_FULL_51_8]|nr:MAG: hypothetical protein A3G38_04340 [Omnitrophica WOR_2 bacterium RIFCSPLOWO2_12_FULL_51_8]
MGCDAFVRKFTRRPKKDNLPQEEMVLAPEEYKAKQATAEESYRQYFLFWQSWQDELIYALLERKSQKKQLDCAREAVKNLLEMRALLRQEKEGEFDRYLAQFRVLEKEINDDLYGNHIPANQRQAEMLRRNFFRDFSPQKIKKYLQ